MTTEPLNPGTVAPKTDGGSGEQPPGTRADGAADGSQETQEQKIARLEAEKKKADDKVAQMLAEKTAVEEERRRLAEERARLQTAPPATDQDPMLAELERLRNYAINNPSDVLAESTYNTRLEAYQRREQERQAQQRQTDRQKAIEYMDRELLSYPEEFRPSIREAMLKGQFTDLATAHNFFKQQKENEELRRDLEAKNRGVASTGGKPAFDPPRQGQAMARSEYQSKLDALQDKWEKQKDRAAYQEAHKLMNDVAAGRITLTG